MSYLNKNLSTFICYIFEWLFCQKTLITPQSVTPVFYYTHGLVSSSFYKKIKVFCVERKVHSGVPAKINSIKICGQSSICRRLSLCILRISTHLRLSRSYTLARNDTEGSHSTECHCESQRLVAI